MTIKFKKEIDEFLDILVREGNSESFLDEFIERYGIDFANELDELWISADKQCNGSEGSVYLLPHKKHYLLNDNIAYNLHIFDDKLLAEEKFYEMVEEINEQEFLMAFEMVEEYHYHTNRLLDEILEVNPCFTTFEKVDKQVEERARKYFDHESYELDILQYIVDDLSDSVSSLANDELLAKLSAAYLIVDEYKADVGDDNNLYPAYYELCERIYHNILGDSELLDEHELPGSERELCKFVVECRGESTFCDLTQFTDYEIGVQFYQVYGDIYNYEYELKIDVD
ncbi:hypothetical protein RZE82_07805 [Mollicutes bacterium LVI A0039]|nr:hypothetical protein RZE82_07805 [Mollicutes bacterium LVI A0039]